MCANYEVSRTWQASFLSASLWGAFTVYLQLAEVDRKKTKKVKEALLIAFTVDPYMAYDSFLVGSCTLGSLQTCIWLNFGAWHLCLGG